MRKSYWCFVDRFESAHSCVPDDFSPNSFGIIATDTCSIEAGFLRDEDDVVSAEDSLNSSSTECRGDFISTLGGVGFNGDCYQVVVLLEVDLLPQTFVDIRDIDVVWGKSDKGCDR